MLRRPLIGIHILLHAFARCQHYFDMLRVHEIHLQVATMAGRRRAISSFHYETVLLTSHIPYHKAAHHSNNVAREFRLIVIIKPEYINDEYYTSNRYKSYIISAEIKCR